ncbi:hypothetical protein BOX37_26305 [Nocardia mangyaensis]|uniref:Uncharacterized protein n=1 Tax=Nocardia mangyaensis TaxID=2213200 RepID=A0A1J0VXS6_9NOCA|nr:DUF4234 domain-containing protein [Nocardia mangyaensis]APE36860.1 hypothetical protein BOX37_26305 [Nocardia mangyaensis]
MTEPYESEKLPAPRETPHHPEPMPQAPPPSTTGFDALNQHPTQPYGDPRYVQPHPPANPGYAHLGFAPQPIYQPVPQAVPVVNVTQNNVGGGYLAVRRGPNHGLHLVLTLITCGLWAPVWILVVILDVMNRK